MSGFKETDPLLSYHSRAGHHYTYGMDTKVLVALEPIEVRTHREDEEPQSCTACCAGCCVGFSLLAFIWLFLFGIYLASGWDEYIDGINWVEDQRKAAKKNIFIAAFMYLGVFGYSLYKVREENKKRTRQRYDPLGS